MLVHINGKYATPVVHHAILFNTAAALIPFRIVFAANNPSLHNSQQLYLCAFLKNDEHIELQN